MTTLLESKARPYGSKKGAAISMVVHGVLLGGAIYASTRAVLPEPEKIEEHSILYVAPPQPKVHVAPEPPPPEEKKAAAPKRAEPVRTPRPPRPTPPAPRPQPVERPVVAAAPLVAPINVPTAIPAVDLKAPRIDVSLPPGDAARTTDVLTGRSGRTSESDGDVAGSRGGREGGLGSGDANRAYSENQVERAVQISRAASPRYPDALRSVGVEGEVQVQYIVDQRGRVEPGSIKILSSAHNLFSDAVRRALSEMRFRPAEVGGRPVRQLVVQPFIFKLDRE